MHSGWSRAFMIAASILAGPLGAQLPAGYTRVAGTPLPDTLYESTRAGRFRIRIERVAKDSTERRLIADAESLLPPPDSIDAAVAKSTNPRIAASFARAAARPGPRWWWREANGLWIPYALTGEAVAHTVERVRSLSHEPTPSYFEPGWDHEVYVTYAAAVERTPVPGVAYRVHLKLDYFLDCGARCGYGFMPTRTVDYDAAGHVMSVSGDGVFHERYR